MDEILFELVQKTNIPYEIWRIIKKYVVFNFLNENLHFPVQVLYQDMIVFESETFIHSLHSWEIDTYSRQSGTMIIYRWNSEIRNKSWSGDFI